MFLDRVSVLSEYDSEVHSPSHGDKPTQRHCAEGLYPLGATPGVHAVQRVPARWFSCQYCGDRFPTHDLTFDHVIPRSRGGRTTWENVVTACGGLQSAQGSSCRASATCSRASTTCQPSTWELQDNGRAFPPNYLHASWRDYLYWDSELKS